MASVVDFDDVILHDYNPTRRKRPGIFHADQSAEDDRNVANVA